MGEEFLVGEGMVFEMMLTVPKQYQEIEERQKKLQKLITDGVEQMNAGQLKDFDAVCERLEKKYKDAGLQNKDHYHVIMN